MQKTRLHNIDFLRFLFAIIIVYYHILHSNIIPFIGENEEYLFLQSHNGNAWIIVECFFIISGFFLFQSWKQKNTSVLEFTVRKFIRLWPVLFFSIAISVLFFNANKFSSIFNVLFLQCIGVSLDYQGINWYISPLFWGSLFYYAILKKYNFQTTTICIAVITYLGYAININTLDGSFGRETIFGFVNLALARALAGLGLGYLIAFSLEQLNRCKIRFKGTNSLLFQLLKIVLFTAIELSCFVFLMAFFVLGLDYKNKAIVVIIFSLLLICFILRKGLVSRILNHAVFGFAGKYAYSIYVMQQICFWVLQRTLWRTQIINNVLLCIGLSIMFCGIIGILTYYTIERPASRLISKIEIEEV